MKLHPLLLTVFLLAFFAPALVHADASVRQDSCVVVGEGQTRVYFTVFNEGLPRSICSFELVQESQTPGVQCIATGCGPADGWACSLNLDGGAWYGAPPHDPPRINCIAPDESKGGFYVTINPGFCCYDVQYADATGVTFLAERECFTSCIGLPVEQKTWGAIKQLYQD